MTIYVVIPVFNRLDQTKILLRQLQEQTIYGDLTILIVNDGSSDGTAEYLAKYSDCIVINSDGNRWWGGSIQLAFDYIKSKATLDDWLVLMNNDTEINANYLENILCIAKQNYPAAVGSIVRDRNDDKRVLSYGANIDAVKFRVTDKKSSEFEGISTVRADVLSGRGVIYPFRFVHKINGLRPLFLPHYFADYEFSVRIRKSGCNLIISRDVAVLSDDSFGSRRNIKNSFLKYFHKSSPSYLPAMIKFWFEYVGFRALIDAPRAFISKKYFESFFK